MTVTSRQLQSSVDMARVALSAFNGCRREERANEVNAVRRAADELADLLENPVHGRVRADLVERARDFRDTADSVAANFHAEAESAEWNAANPNG